MRRRGKLAAAAAAGAAAIAAGVGTAVAAGGDDTEKPIPDDVYDKAAEAALEHTGGGRVTETEVGDEESLYEVEVTLDDGRQVDVQLDESFQVVGAEDDERDDDED